MGEHIVKLPDVGEGVAEAELVEWHVKVGDIVREDDALAAVMTDKATVEIPSPVDGEVTWVGGEIGDTIAIGSALVRVKTGGDTAEAPAKAEPEPESAPEPAPPAAKAETPIKPAAPPPPAGPKPAAAPAAPRRAAGEKPVASPAVRLAAREAGVDLRQVAGSGPGGRITHGDLAAFEAGGGQPGRGGGLVQKSGVTEVKVVGLRRRIAEKMALSKSRIPHITIVEEVDVTSLEELRAGLNKKPGPERPKLT
ncbi:MAG TPA: biotin/lipoyl-containing protein, partial [Caulobacteraceae bacterium]